jgi:Domain of unknown function (DUF1871).
MTYDKIKEVIDEWDPMNFWDLGCPKDEYDPEIRAIYNKLNDSSNIEEASLIIYDIFVTMFGKDIFNKDISNCKEIAANIL